MKVKKKLLIIGSSQNLYGGIEAFMIAIAEAAKSWVEFDTKICFKFSAQALPDDNLKRMAEKACEQVQFVVKGSAELMQLIKWADVLHVQNMPPDIVIPAWLRRKKIFLTVHNRRQHRNDLHEYIWRITIKMATKRWFNSQFVWNSWEPGTKSKNSACVPTVCRLPTTYVEPAKRKGFVYVGRWIENKGLEEAIEAYKIAGLDKENWPLVLMGDGPIRNRVFSLIETSGCKQYIRTPGFVSDEEKQLAIAGAKWLLAPAKTLEDLGLTPIEARAVGVPAIVTRDGGLPEAGGPSAIVVEPGNVSELAAAMKEVSAMAAGEYEDRSNQGKESLKTFLKPVEFYKDAFLHN